MRIDLCYCNVIELTRDCTVTLTARGDAALIGVRGELWVTSTANRDDVVLKPGDRLALARGAATYVTPLVSGALRIVQTRERNRPGWFELLMRKWVDSFDMRAAACHARQYGRL